MGSPRCHREDSNPLLGGGSDDGETANRRLEFVADVALGLAVEYFVAEEMISISDAAEFLELVGVAERNCYRRDRLPMPNSRMSDTIEYLPKQKQEKSDEPGRKMKTQSRSIEEESSSRNAPRLKP